MTRQHNGHAEATPFSGWLRSLPAPLDSSNVSLHDLDYVWHDYRRNYILTIEEKQNGDKCKPAQEDTHGVVAQMLRYADGMTVSTHRGWRSARYFGHYVISFEKTSPDDGSFSVNGRPCSSKGLLRLLAFDQEAIDALTAVGVAA